MSHFLIVGKGFSSLKNKILERGDTYTLLQDITVTKYPNQRLKHRILADFGTKSSILQTVHSLDKHFDGVVSMYENYVLPASWIAEDLELPGLPVEAAEACTDKQKMRELFAQVPNNISPDFSEVHSLEDVLTFADRHDYPLILKPANLAKSLLVTKSNDRDELIDNYQRSTESIDKIYQKYAPHRRPKILIEEFMTGSIHSVDAFVDSNGEPHILEQIVDYQTGYDIGYDDNFHYSRLLPSQLSPDNQEKLRQVAAEGTRALGMRNSPAHIEVIMTSSGPKIVEIGARNGGYRERMHGLANGIDILGTALDLAIGKKPVTTPGRRDGCAVLELFPKSPGNFVGIAQEHALRQLPSLNYLGIKAQPGQFVGKAADGYKMCAVIILHNSDRRQFNADLEYVNNHITVQTTT